MAKEILLYSDFFRFTAEMFVRDMEAASGEDVVIRLYSNGGNPSAGYSMLSKLVEHTGKVSLKIDGSADSMAAFFMCYVDDVQCLDVSTFTFHRAAYEDETNISESARAERDRINAFLRKGLEKKVGPEKFKALKGVSLDQLFATDTRIDVTLTAEDAIELGLVKKVVPITDMMASNIKKSLQLTASTYAQKLEASSTAAPKPEEKQTIKTIAIMTIEKLKAEHPDVFKAAFDSGVAQERDRAGAWLAYLEADSKAVSEGIKKGENLSMTAMAELGIKMFNNKNLKALEEGSEGNVDTKEVKAEKDGADPKAKKTDPELEAFEKEVKNELKHLLKA